MQMQKLQVFYNQIPFSRIFIDISKACLLNKTLVRGTFFIPKSFKILKIIHIKLFTLNLKVFGYLLSALTLFPFF